ncbi:unnamed protein product [Schistosoma curassoni]|uniref:Aldo_ket_red domain-containing protein n=1 Tax=Schistosoma curassoni TaxID=6186 RepID=A0A183L2D7_9TREM|nr:unnamed protein product [Schistosoma curassoni]
MLIYSGQEKENAQHTLGVTLTLSKDARKVPIGWESPAPKIIIAFLKAKKEGITMNVIQCYAPINDSNDDHRDQFYERMQSIIAKCTGKRLTILMGGRNAKVGMYNIGRPSNNS